MDVEKLIDRLYTKQQSYDSYTDSEFTHVMEDAITALSTLQVENEKLKDQLYDGEGVNLVNYWIQQAKIEENGHRNCQAENEKLRAELEQMKRERDAAIKDIWVSKWTSCKYGKDCTFTSARTGFPDCAGCGDWEWRGQKED